MIISNGLGFLVAAIPFASCLLSQYLLDAQLGKGYYTSHSWAIGTAVSLGGLVSAGIGFLLASRPNRTEFDQRTGVVLVHKRTSHSIFFVPMHWAGLLVAATGVVIAVMDAV